MTVLFEQVNEQLAAAGFHVKSSQGAIVDATIITSAARPRKELSHYL